MSEHQLTMKQRMDAFSIYIPYIEQHGINETILTRIIDEHKSIKTDVEKLQKRYNISKDGVPILTRTPNTELFSENAKMRRIDTLINNKLNNPFDGDVVDTKVGYFLGHPINYVVDARKELRLQALAEANEAFFTRNNVPDKDTSLGLQTSIAGYGARLVHWATENNKPVMRIANVNPAECIFLYDEAMSEPRYAIQYFDSAVIDENGNKRTVTKVEFHDALETYFFHRDQNGLELINYMLHGFDYCPLIGEENNNELHGEAVKILNLVDAYDRTMSDANSEIEAMRLAILILRNIGMDEEDIQEMQNNGVLEMFGEDADVKFLTKDVNDSMIEHMLDRLEKNIHKFAKSVDFGDEAFAGNISGIAMKFKTMSLEHKSIIAEHKRRSMLQQQYKIMCSGWAKLSICQPEDYLKIWFGFKRNLPSNLLEESQTTMNLKGNVSERTRLSLLSFVDDVDAELEEMQKDAERFAEQLSKLDDGEEDVDDEVIEDGPTNHSGTD